MKKKKQLLSIFLFVIAGWFLSIINVIAVINPTSNFYINDFAEVLNKETEDYILSNSAALADRTTAQLVVVTVKSLSGKDLEDYSLEIFRSWGIGHQEKNNGVLIFLAVEEHEVRIQVGDALEGRINDAKAGRFLDEYGIALFKNDEWDVGIKALYSAILVEIYSEYNLEPPEEVSKLVAEHDYTSEDSKIEIVMGIIMVLLMFVFGGILPIVFRKKRFHDGKYTDIDMEPGSGLGEIFFSGKGFSSGGSRFTGGGGTSSGGGASRKF